MTAPYTNQLINRVRQDIAYSQNRNRAIQAMGVVNQVPTSSGLGVSAVGGGTVTGGFTDKHGTRLATITTPWGQHVTVNASAAGKFSALFKGLNAMGYKPKSAGGYNYRNIAGTNTLSKHALGLAVDLDPQENRGGRLGGGGTRYGYFDPQKVMALAKSLGLSWGATFSNPDPMHFSIGEG